MRIRVVLLGAAAALAFPAAASAHGIGGVRDLPVPLWLFYYGGAIVLIVSFIALGVLWRRPLLEAHAAGRPLPAALQRVLLSSALRVLLGAVGFFLLVLVFATALFGSSVVDRNLAPAFVYVFFWLGFVPLVVILGNVWPVLNPWRAAADAYVWSASRLGLQPRAVSDFPAQWGRWPATALLFLWATLELAYFDPSNPRVLAIAILFYSFFTWYGMAVFGRLEWLEGGEAFNVYFGLLARIAPFAVREDDGKRVVVIRPPARRAEPARADTGNARVRGRHARLGHIRRLQPHELLAGLSCRSGRPLRGRLSDCRGHRHGPRQHRGAGNRHRAGGARVPHCARRRASARERAARGLGFRAHPRPDRARLRGGALFLSSGRARPVCPSSCLRSLRARLGPLRYGGLQTTADAPRRTSPGTSRSRHSSSAT